MKRQANPMEPYSLLYSSPVPEYLNSLERHTHLHTLAPQMMAGKYQGRLLSMISKMLQPHVILEIGTFTGYSTLCLSEGLVADGKIYTIEVNDELAHISQRHFDLSPFKNNIIQYHGRAEDIIPEMTIKPDLVFMDAGKQDYPKHFELCLELMAVGGWILADNVLWSNKVMSDKKDADTEQMERFNQKVKDDPRTENLILPIRDGLSLIRKIR